MKQGERTTTTHSARLLYILQRFRQTKSLWGNSNAIGARVYYTLQHFQSLLIRRRSAHARVLYTLQQFCTRPIPIKRMMLAAWRKYIISIYEVTNIWRAHHIMIYIKVNILHSIKKGILTLMYPHIFINLYLHGLIHQPLHRWLKVPIFT